MRHDLHRFSLAAATAALAGLGGGAARAGGFEYPDNGAEAIGRGGAFTARADSPAALMHNVAGIAGLSGVQVTLSSNLSVLSNCLQRPGTYDGMDNYNVVTAGTVFAASHYADQSGVVPYPRVCTDSGPSAAPQLLATFRLSRSFAVGVGVYSPNGLTGWQHFPDRVTTTMGPAPSPSRYLLLDEQLVIVHPTIALAGAPVPWLRLGVALQPSVAHLEFATMANAVAGMAQSPASDIQTRASTTGFFMAYNLGLQLIPSRYFSLGAHAHVNPQTVSLSGTGTAVVGPYAAPPNAPIVSTFRVDRMAIALPLQVRLGARFALPRNPGLDTARGDYDPMRDDVFDVEIDGVYETASRFQTLRLDNRGQIDLGAARVPVPNVQVPHNWHDVWGVRVGGDANVVPNLLTLRAGFSYETGAQTTEYASLDVPSYDTLGVHGGISVRWRWLTLTAAYSHLFMSDLVASDGMLPVTGPFGPVSAADCRGAGPGACHVNRGVYQAALDAVSLGLTGRL